MKTLLCVDAAALYRFKQEFRTLADVQHQNLVQLYELVVSNEAPVFFTMELVDGVDFRNTCAALGRAAARREPS